LAARRSLLHDGNLIARRNRWLLGALILTALVVTAARGLHGAARIPVLHQSRAVDPDASLYGLDGSRPPPPRSRPRVAHAAPALDERVRTQPRELARDRFRGQGAQKGTAVEPASAAHGSTVVAAYQVGRFIDGGALAIGFSTSANAGRTWRSGLLPSLSRAAKPAGDAEFVADPSVAYDAKHRYWLIASLTALPSADTVAVSRSPDGVTWQAPITAVRSDSLDKSWITCDNWVGSPHRGNCYLAYLEIPTDAIVLRTSKDGGKTWSRSVAVAYGSKSHQSINGAQPLILPSGAVVVAFTALAGYPASGGHEIAVARSTDGGATFGIQQHVGSIEEQGSFIYGMRAPQFPSGAVDAGGTIYLTWHDCPNYACQGNEILFSRSADAINWSEPRALPVASGRETADAVLPALAVAPGTRGARARLAVSYYSMRCAWLTNCALDAFLERSPDGGRSWKTPERLNPKTMRLDWLADTNLGRMVGDYISTSFAGLRPVPVLALAGAPAQGRFNEAIFASRLPGS
jgi:hypothetical protein